MTSFVVGSVLGGAVVGSLLTILGGAFSFTAEASVILLLTVGIWAALVQLGWRYAPRLEHKRQVPRDWRVKLSPPTYAALYGLILGTGIATPIAHATLYVVVAVALVSHPPTALMVMVTYALTRALAVVVASAPLRGRYPVAWTNLVQLASPLVLRLNAIYLAAIVVVFAAVVVQI